MVGEVRVGRRGIVQRTDDTERGNCAAGAGDNKTSKGCVVVAAPNIEHIAVNADRPNESSHQPGEICAQTFRASVGSEWMAGRKQERRRVKDVAIDSGGHPRSDRRVVRRAIGVATRLVQGQVIDGIESGPTEIPEWRGERRGLGPVHLMWSAIARGTPWRHLPGFPCQSIIGRLDGRLQGGAKGNSRHAHACLGRNDI